MRNLLFLLATVCCLGFLSGCQSSGVKHCSPLTADEKQKLIEISRTNLLRDRGLLSTAEKNSLKKATAEFNAKYTDDKYGKAYIIWKFPTREIIIEVFGNLERGPRKWSIRVVQFKTNNMITKEQSAKMKKLKTRGLDNFKGMLLPAGGRSQRKIK